MLLTLKSECGTLSKALQDRHGFWFGELLELTISRLLPQSGFFGLMFSINKGAPLNECVVIFDRDDGAKILPSLARGSWSDVNIMRVIDCFEAEGMYVVVRVRFLDELMFF